MPELNDTTIRKLLKDEREAARLLSHDEVRYLVSAYYTMQDNRMRADAQARTLAKEEKPNEVISWLGEQNRSLENQIKLALDAWSGAHPVGAWMRSHLGVGPVIASGLLAHLSIARAPTVGHWYSFAGIVNGQKWEKGQKRPWNADLKVLCYKLGEAFVKVCNNDDAIYGQHYKTRKAQETAKNEAGDFKDQAEAVLANKRIGRDTDAYKAYSQGKLPPAHIHARARRYAVKLFLSHMHHAMYVHETGEAPAKPYAIAHLGHAHFEAPVYGSKAGMFRADVLKL